MLKLFYISSIIRLIRLIKNMKENRRFLNTKGGYIMNIKVLQNKIKMDTIILWGFCILCGLVILFHLNQINQYSQMNNSSFEVKLGPTDTTNNTYNYYLYIDGEQYYPVDYNNYGRLDENGNMNIKANIIIDHLNGIVKSILIEIILVLLYGMLTEVKKGITPFSMRNVCRLRIIAFLSFFVALLPVAVTIISSMIVFQYLTVEFSSLNFYIIFIGVVFGIISEIFKYGCVLQEDIDQIV